MDEAIINKFINNALVYLSCSYASEFENANTNIREIYPYIFHELYLDKNKCKQVMEYDSLGIMYESIIPNSIKKDLGQFYTREDGMIEYMLDKVDLLSGKILEPSCGSGVFVCKIIKKMVSMLQDKGYTACQILDYICDNIYSNDMDKNALVITEINSLAELLPLMVCARKENENYVMPRLNISSYDFTKKNIFKGYAIIIGNPPFVTMYGKRSRNMTEEKRAFYNTFDFVQNKKGNNKFNLSMFFIENGLKALEDCGHLCFIMDIAFFETAFVDLRRYIVQNYTIKSITRGLQAFEGVASGQLIIDVMNCLPKKNNVELVNFENKTIKHIEQVLWNDKSKKYKFFEPLSEIQEQINEKLTQYDNLEKYYPNKCLRTCCALTGKTDEFIVDPDESKEYLVLPYIEGSKGLTGKFQRPTPQRCIKYDYELQLKLSDQFKEELEKAGVKNKKRVTLGDKDAYLAPKVFIRQSATEIIATYCDKPYAANNSIYILTNKENTEQSKSMLKYICGVLNSDLVTFYCRINKIIRAEKGKTPQIKISDLKDVRIHVDKHYFEEIVQIVEQLLRNPKDKMLSRRLNELVYIIYGIDENERKFITDYLTA